MMCLFYDNAVILKKDTTELPQISYCSVPVTVARIVKMPFIRKLAILYPVTAWWQHPVVILSFRHSASVVLVVVATCTFPFVAWHRER